MTDAADLASALNIAHADAFATGLLRVPFAERAVVADALMMRQVEHRWGIADDDVAALTEHAHVMQLTCYGMEDADEIAQGGDPWENFATEIPLAAQVHPRLIDAFRSRPTEQQRALIAAWWGANADPITDLVVLVEWVAVGAATIHRGVAYFEAVTELMVEVTRRHTDGVDYVKARPFLADDFLQALTMRDCYGWLARNDVPGLAAHLHAFADAGALDVNAIVALIDAGLDRGWGGSQERREAIQDLRAMLSPTRAAT